MTQAGIDGELHLSGSLRTQGAAVDRIVGIPLHVDHPRHRVDAAGSLYVGDSAASHGTVGTDGPVLSSAADLELAGGGVGTMILGQVTKAGERLVATTELVNVEDGRVLSSTKAEGRSVEEIFTGAKMSA